MGRFYESEVKYSVQLVVVLEYPKSGVKFRSAQILLRKEDTLAV